MGKDGPCFHCGISSSPLWRNGPPSKPVLCNACGSRWRTKGTLANYRPLHAKLLQGPDALDDKLPPFHISTAYHVQRHFENSLGVPVKTNVDVGVKSNAKQYVYYKSLKRGTVGNKSPSGGTVSNKAPSGGIVSNKAPSGGTVSNKSPSGSAISISESDNHSESSEGNAVPDPPQKHPPQKQIWEMQIPSRKRTKVTHELISVSPMESFRREMLKLYQQQLLELAELSKSSENIFVERQSVSIYSETALGACLLKPPGDSNAVPEPSSHVIIDNEKPCFNEKSSLIESTGGVNEMKTEPAKENTLTTKSLVSASFSLPDVYVKGNVPQPSTSGSLISSHTSRFIGSRFSELVNQKHPPEYKGIAEKLSDADREWKMNFEYDFST